MSWDLNAASRYEMQKLKGPLAVPIYLTVGIILLVIFSNQVIPQVAKESVCLHNSFISKIVCWFFTNSLLGLVILILSIIGLYFAVKKYVSE